MKSLSVHLSEKMSAADAPAALLSLQSTPDVDGFLHAAGEVSPFLRRLITRDNGRVERVLAATPDDQFAALFPAALDDYDDVNAVKVNLRNARYDLALAIALADLSGLWSVDTVTACLSDFADRAIDIALECAWQTADTLRGVEFNTPPKGRPVTGIAIISMGKLGARELNYSSDIDLIAVYEPTALGVNVESHIPVRTVAVKIVQRMVDILSQQTEHGFVFRTDLRLRPNPSATPVAVSLAAAEQYYEEYGQNWERAAFIKSRYSAGDVKIGKEFLSMMKPFVWRRSLDFTAVADIYAVKKQIHAEKGLGDILVAGGDMKVGPGGIREIEFFAQMQQLLYGGRDPSIRSPRTVAALIALAAADHVDDETVTQLVAAYDYLRRLEHRLQMREDTQTQIVPTDEDALLAVAQMMNATTLERFIDETWQILRFVHDTYADLFPTPEPDEPLPGSLVFTGVEDDPRTVATLEALGFAQPNALIGRVRRWHMGGLKATRSAQARALLTAMTPRILTQLAQARDPDTAFSALDDFLVALPSGFQVFSLFTAHAEVLDDVLLLCRAAPALAKKLGARPSLVEGLLEGFDAGLPDIPPHMAEETLEDRLDLVRRIVNEHRVRSSAAVVLGRADAVTVSRAMADLADQAIAALIEAVRRDLASTGRDPAGAIAVIGFGRLGQRGLTPASDLDIVFVYEADDPTEEGIETRFTRLVRRIVSALSVPTAEGELFEIDMKLRPSGGAGPTAVTLSAFDRYYEEKAWVWEEMALTKSRVVAGDYALALKLHQVIERHLCRARDPEAVKHEVIDMRERLLREKSARSALDIKRLHGGLTDIDFLIEGLSLIHAHEIGRVETKPAAALAQLTAARKLPQEMAADLVAARQAFESLIHYTRAVHGTVPPDEIGDVEADRLRRLSPIWSDAPIDEQVAAHAATVRAAFEETIGKLPNFSNASS